MSFADVAEECIQTRYPRKAWIGRLVTPLLLSPAVFTMAADARVLFLVKAVTCNVFIHLQEGQHRSKFYSI